MGSACTGSACIACFACFAVLHYLLLPSSFARFADLLCLLCLLCVLCLHCLPLLCLLCLPCLPCYLVTLVALPTLVACLLAYPTVTAAAAAATIYNDLFVLFELCSRIHYGTYFVASRSSWPASLLLLLLSLLPLHSFLSSAVAAIRHRPCYLPRRAEDVHLGLRDVVSRVLALRDQRHAQQQRSDGSGTRVSSHPLVLCLCFMVVIRMSFFVVVAVVFGVVLWW